MMSVDCPVPGNGHQAPEHSPGDSKKKRKADKLTRRRRSKAPNRKRMMVELCSGVGSLAATISRRRIRSVPSSLFVAGYDKHTAFDLLKGVRFPEAHEVGQARQGHMVLRCPPPLWYLLEGKKNRRACQIASNSVGEQTRITISSSMLALCMQEPNILAKIVEVLLQNNAEIAL